MRANSSHIASNHLVRIWLCGALLLSLAACSRSPSTSKLAAENDDRIDGTPVFILQGGFNSCQDLSVKLPDQKFYLSSATWRQQIASHFTLPPLIIATCYGTGARTVRLFRSTGDLPQFFDADTLPDTLKSIILSVESPQVFFAGHSYGGWQATRAAHLIRESIPVHSLATIDPISTLGCSPYAYVRSRIIDVFGGRMVKGCLQSPADQFALQTDLRASLPTGSWLNAFQTAARTLHSSEIDAAPKNLLYSFGEDGAVTAHTLIDNDARVWSDYTQQSLDSLSQSRQRLAVAR